MPPWPARTLVCLDWWQDCTRALFGAHCVAEVPGFMLAMSFVERIRRHVVLAGTLALAGTCGLAADATSKPAGPVGFFAVLTADEQSATTLSPGVGRADFSLDRNSVRLSWKVSYSKLTTPARAAGVHGPQRPGTNAGVQINLAPKGLASPLQGSAVLTDAQLEYLLAGRMYVNITSAKYPAGELRGQIQRMPPPTEATR